MTPYFWKNINWIQGELFLRVLVNLVAINIIEINSELWTIHQVHNYGILDCFLDIVALCIAKIVLTIYLILKARKSVVKWTYYVPQIYQLRISQFSRIMIYLVIILFYFLSCLFLQKFAWEQLFPLFLELDL